jgi:hypothetical protein
MRSTTAPAGAAGMAEAVLVARVAGVVGATGTAVSDAGAASGTAAGVPQPQWPPLQDEEIGKVFMALPVLRPLETL